jgi:protein ImuB
VDPVRFVEVVEFDYEIVTIEPLTFILSRMLDGICARLLSRNLATHEVHLALGTSVRVLNLPMPVRNSKLLTRLLILDLEARPPGVPVRRVEVEAIPAKPRVVQNGLFVPLSPEPEKLELTLARLKAVVGEENVGAAEVSDTHRPDAFELKKFVVLNSPPQLRRGGPKGRGGAGQENHSIDQHHPSRRYASALPSSAEEGSFSTIPISTAFPTPNFTALSLRRFRPPLDTTIQLRGGLPIWIAFHGVHGPIASASGPWHTSGDWWRPTMWDREEWDIEVRDTLYRIYYDVHMDRWYTDGVYD